MEESSNSMVKLIASNYSIKKTMVKNILYCNELFDLIELKCVKLVAARNNDWKKLNRRAV
jgi:hypothetical protein